MAAQSTYSLAFASVTDLVSVTSGFTGPSGDFSLSGWVRLTSTATTQIVLEFQGGAGDGGALQCHNGVLSFVVFGIANYDFSTLTLTAGVWQHWALTRTGNNVIGYLNGVSESTTISTVLGFMNSSFRIGDNAFGVGFVGSVDDVALIYSVLTPTQVSNIAGTPGVAGSSSLDVSTLTTQVLWRLESGSGTTAIDSSGNGHDGTLTGSITWSTLNDVPLPLQAAAGGPTSPVPPALIVAGSNKVIPGYLIRAV